MARGQLYAALRHWAGAADDDDSDRRLLERFADAHDEAAFAAVVQRHGPMVLGVCRRVLGNAHDADDAFQATFLVLARKAGALPWQGSVGGWLYQVATRVALKLRGENRRAARREPAASGPPDADPIAIAAGRELRAALDEEIGRLPEKYRLPLLLCGLNGLSRAEAARRLKWREGTVAGRLGRARDLLRQRLGRRGHLIPAAALAALLAEEASASKVPAAMVDAAAKTAFLYVTGQGVTGAASVALALGVARTMALARLRLPALVLLLGLMAGGAGVLAHQAIGDKEPVEQSPPAATAEAAPPHEEMRGATDRYGDPLPQYASARLGTVRFRTGGLVYACACSPDGKLIAAASADGSLHLFDAATGKPLRRAREHHMGDVTAVAFAPDGRRIATGGTDAAVVLQETAGGKVLQQMRLPNQNGLIRALAFSPDGKWLASAGPDHALHLWETATGRELRKLEGHQGEIWSVAIAPDGRTLASGGEDKTVRLWDAATGKCIHRLTDFKEPVKAVIYSPDGNTLAVGDRAGLLRVWAIGANARPVEPCRVLHKPTKFPSWPGIWALAFTHDGKTLAAGCSDHTIYLWDAATGKVLQRREGRGTTLFARSHQGGISSIAFAPDGKALAFTEDNRVGLLDAATGKEADGRAVQGGNVQRVFFTPDGKGAITTSDDKPLGLLEWDLTSHRPPRPLPCQTSSIYTVAFSPDGTVLAAYGARDDQLHLSDPRTGKDVRRIRLPDRELSGTIHAIRFSPDGRLLAVAGDFRDRSLPVYEAATGKQVRQLDGHGDHVWSLDFTPDGKALVASEGDAHVRLYNLATGKVARTFAGAGFWPQLVARDGKTLVTVVPPANAGTNQRICFWDSATGKLVRELPTKPFPHEPWVICLALSPDGRMLAVGTMDGLIRLWEVGASAERRTLRGHLAEVHRLTFSPDGRTLASASNDTTALLWDVYATDGAPARLTAEQAEKCWRDLAGEAAGAFAAVCTLIQSPQSAVPLLRHKLPPVRPADSERVARLLHDLDRDEFRLREQAGRELEQLGFAAEPALRQALTDKRSLESRRRIERVLEKLEGIALLRVARAVEVLEHIDTADATQLLQTLAAGAPEARQTQEAKAALSRRQKQ